MKQKELQRIKEIIELSDFINKNIETINRNCSISIGTDMIYSYHILYKQISTALINELKKISDDLDLELVNIFKKEINENL